MFARRRKEVRYTREQTIRWLTWLARGMMRQAQAMFFIERLQPGWLQTHHQQWFYRIVGRLINGLVFALVLGVGSGLIGVLISGLLFGLGAGLAGDLLSGLVRGTIGGLNDGLRVLAGGLGLGLFIGMSVGLVLGLATKPGQIETVEALSWSWEESKSELRIGLLSGAIFGLVIGLAVELTGGWEAGRVELFIGPSFGLVSGLIGGLFSGLNGWLEYSGRAFTQHIALRLIFWRSGVLPWNIVPFLDYCAERIFLRKVGGGYIFVHRLLMEHFASKADE